MSLQQCKICGKPFVSKDSELCTECMQAADNAYVKIKKYIYLSSGKTDYSSIAENTGVSEIMLSYLIKEGRVVLGSGMGGRVKCRACGKETDGNILCERCRGMLTSEKLFPQVSKKNEKDQKEYVGRTKPLQVKD